MIHAISIYNKPEFPENKGPGILHQAKEFLGVKTIEDIKCVKKYYLEGVSEADALRVTNELFCEDLWQSSAINKPFFDDTAHHIEVAYKPGIMNPEVGSIIAALQDMGISDVTAADSSLEYFFYGANIDKKEVDEVVKRFLLNPLIEDVRKETPPTLHISGEIAKTETVPIRDLDDDALMGLSKDTLFLELHEMQAIQKYFQDRGRDPTDGELETIAQTWSEHCYHKTFRAKLRVDGKEKEPLFTRLKKSTHEINHPSVVSAFNDNSGVFDFFGGYAVCGKVETHNSPSALDPYGGAMTGSGGVFRDILGTGQGSKVVASTDIFCFGPPDSTFESVPAGCKHPRYIFKRVIDGVRDYGNRIGIPTNNGSVHFHPDFRAKPAVIVGAYGLMPKDKAKQGKPQPGDHIIVLGGPTGRDGIHGATFSSAEMTDKTESINASAVQIGNAIEEHRVIHAVIESRDKGFIRAITDCGAGGFSSAIGEMGEETGAIVMLEKIPLKYMGLAPWEIWLSESQERMVMAVDPANSAKVLDICAHYNVEATVIGEFTDTKRLDVRYSEQQVCDIDMEFLHDGIPDQTLEATYVERDFPEPVLERKDDHTEDCKAILKHWNVCSKEAIVRQYDHNVQGGAVQMPFAGKTHSAPNDGAVIEPLLGTKHGLAISNGLNPILNRIDPYAGSQWAIIEAVSNVVALGADPAKIALIDNFIWPRPTPEFLGDLDRSVDACTDTAKVFGMPFISGKDSLSATYKSGDTVINIPPTLCISCFAPIENIDRTISSPFKEPGNQIYVLGETTNEMGGSVFYETQDILGKRVPSCDISKLREMYTKLHQAITKGLVKACHDISEGGMAVALIEMCFGSLLGIEAEVTDCPVKEGTYTASHVLFSETPGRFVVEVPEADAAEFKEIMRDVPLSLVGTVNRSGVISIAYQEKEVVRGDTKEFFKIWKEPIDKIFA